MAGASFQWAQSVISQSNVCFDIWSDAETQESKGPSAKAQRWGAGTRDLRNMSNGALNLVRENSGELLSSSEPLSSRKV